MQSKAFLVQVSFTVKAKTSLTMGPFASESLKIHGRSSSAASAAEMAMGCEGSKEPASVALATRVGCDSSAAATELRLARLATKVPEAGFS